MARILLVMIIGGGALGFFGFQEMRLANAAKPEPQEISCAQLIESGTGDNAHIVLKDYLMCDFAFVYQAKKNGGRWQNVWVPVVPVGGEFHEKVLGMLKADGTLGDATPPMPTDIRVIVKSSKVGDESELGSLASRETLQGVIVNKISSLGSKEKKILSESYPSVNFDNVLILEHDRHPSSAGKSIGMMGGGGLLIAAGLLGFIKTRKS